MSTNHETIAPADNAPAGALDVWLRIPDDADESEAEANVFPEGHRFRVEWYLTAVGLVKRRHYDTYAEATEWLTRAGYADFSA